MRRDHSVLAEVSPVKIELSDSELETIVGGRTKTFQANAGRFDPYKSFKFRLT
jgi:bacteriocin-like protein